MKGQTSERWLILCEQAAVEQDPQRLMELREIDELLREKQGRINPQAPQTRTVA